MVQILFFVVSFIFIVSNFCVNYICLFVQTVNFEINYFLRYLYVKGNFQKSATWHTQFNN